ncbi:unnamed protein product [Diamesa hyperborea]
MLALRQLIRFNCTTSLFLRSSSVLINVKNNNNIELYNERRILKQNTPLVTIYRNKYDKSKKSKREADDDEDDKEETDDYEELLGDNKNSKVIRKTVNSLRVDLLLKTGINLARNKVEVAFYENKIRVNGKRILKKSMVCNCGDEIDLLKGESRDNPNHLVVSRVEILSEVTKEDGSLLVTMKAHKSLLIDKYDD